MIVNDDTIEKICFIEVYGQTVAQDLVTEIDFEKDPLYLGLKEIKKRVPLDEKRFGILRSGIIALCKKGVNEVIVGIVLSHSLASFPAQFISHDDFKYLDLMWKLDMFELYYQYPHAYARTRENSLNEAEWKLDALHLYLTIDDGIKATILSENVDKLEEIKTKRAETIRQQEESYANFEDEYEIIAEQNKIKERERKKALKEEAKRRMALETKMENHEIYGEVLYKGEMFTIRSREDLEQLMQRLL